MDDDFDDEDSLFSASGGDESTSESDLSDGYGDREGGGGM